jgi:hypothetical protein
MGSRPAFAFSNVTPLKFFNAIFKIKSNSVGLDEIPLRFLKLFINSILNHLTYIFNMSMTSGIFPTAWKSSKLEPIAKIPDPLETNLVFFLRCQRLWRF